MAIKVYKKTGNARRLMSVLDFSHLTKKRPERSLITIKKEHAGRNAAGKITVRHRGAGERRYYRIVDFKRDKFDVPATVASLEYDPNRSANIALLVYRDGEKRYIVAPAELKVGQTVVSSKSSVDVKIGNCTTLENIPIGSLVHNIELVPGQGAVMSRTAGSSCKLMAVEGGFAHLKLASSEVRLVMKECLATIGQVGNADWMHVKIGKAGRNRHLGWRPEVRGKVMNPVDHPHGGGEGHSPIGLKHPKTPWGKPALGKITRKFEKASNKFIIQRRKKKN